MGKFLDYYCPFCGKEYSLFYENSICQNCSSALYARYDYFPARKIKLKIRSTAKDNDMLTDIIPFMKAGNNLDFEKATSLIPLVRNDEKNIAIYLKNEGENVSGCFAERGLKYVFSEGMFKRKPGALFFNESIYTAIFLRNLLKPELKLLIPDFLGENNINKIFRVTDNVDVVEGEEVFLKLLKFDGKSFFHALNDFTYMEGLKRIFFEIAFHFKAEDKIHFIIPGNCIELLLAWGKAFQELKLLSIIKPRNFILHSYFDQSQMGPVEEFFLTQFKKQIFSLIKESGGSVLQVGKNELETDIVRKQKKIGLSLSNSALTSMIIAELLIDGNKIAPSQNVVCLNMNQSNLDFDRPFK